MGQGLLNHTVYKQCNLLPIVEVYLAHLKVNMTNLFTFEDFYHTWIVVGSSGFSVEKNASLDEAYKESFRHNSAALTTRPEKFKYMHMENENNVSNLVNRSIARMSSTDKEQLIKKFSVLKPANMNPACMEWVKSLLETLKHNPGVTCQFCRKQILDY